MNVQPSKYMHVYDRNTVTVFVAIAEYKYVK